LHKKLKGRNNGKEFFRHDKSFDTLAIRFAD
jgi:hypothetical protein